LGNESGLIAYWNFNTNQPYADLSGNGHNGTPHGEINIVDSSAPITGWLSADPLSSSLEPGAALSVNLFFDARILDVGNYTTTLMITSNDPDEPLISVPISMDISDLENDQTIVPGSSNNLLFCYPNPFNPSTTISFNLSSTNTQNARIEIYNLKGQKVKTFLIDRSIDSKNHSVTWNGTDNNNKPVSSGIYFYRLKSDGIQQTRKMLLLK